MQAAQENSMANGILEMKMKNHGRSLMAVLGALALTFGMAVQSQAQGRSDLALAALENTSHMPGELIVQFQPGISAQGKAQALGRVGAKHEDLLVGEAWRGDRKGDLELVSLPPGIGIAAAVRGLEQDANVEFAEPNWIYFHMDTSNDTYYTNGSLWGMYGDTSPLKTNLYGSQAGEAWAAGKTDCSTVWVGIIDEGYMYTHEDLAANAGTNPGEVAGNGIDDDGNGYVDDVYGWDFDGKNNTVFDGTSDDHGTHVAGTIGGVGGNGKGVAGVCWQVKLMGAKFLGKRGGTTANAIKAVDYFTDLKLNGLNFVATNNSWGGGGYSQGLYDAIDRANAADVLFVAAAGNGGSDGVGDNNDLTPHYPSSYDNANIIAVAAITSTGAKASFSNYGTTSVDIGAPGYGIWSTVPITSGRGKTATTVSGYASYSGTSMATPHVTGAVALYAATHAGSSAAQIKDAILGSAIFTTSLDGKTITDGRLDVSGF
jgi:subtilisin family serine protease